MSKAKGKPETGNRAECRPKGRVPIYYRNRLKWNEQDPAYKYRFVNDIEDRVPRFKDAGYEAVESKAPVAEQRGPGDPAPLASYVEKSVGGGDKAVLMRIKKEWYEEDQAKKQKNIDETERSMDPRVREEKLRQDGHSETGMGGADAYVGSINISR